MNSKKIPARKGRRYARTKPGLCTSTISCKWPWTQSAAGRWRVQTQRFRLALLLHEQPNMKNDKAAKEVGLSARQVQRWRSRWAAGDFSIEDRAGRGRKPVFPPSGLPLNVG